MQRLGRLSARSGAWVDMLHVLFTLPRSSHQFQHFERQTRYSKEYEKNIVSLSILKATPLYAGAKQQCYVQSSHLDNYSILCFLTQLLSEPRTKPALGLFCCLEGLLVEGVNGRVDLLASAGELPLGLGLCLLVLLPCLDAVLVKLLLGLVCLGLGLVGLWIVSTVLIHKMYHHIHIAEQLSGLPRNPPRQPS